MSAIVSKKTANSTECSQKYLLETTGSLLEIVTADLLDTLYSHK